jgi:hypothetical protein
MEWAFKKKNEMGLQKTLKNIKSFDILKWSGRL